MSRLDNIASDRQQKNQFKAFALELFLEASLRSDSKADLIRNFNQNVSQQ